MDWVQIEGTQIPLLEAPQKYENPPRRILYVIFKHKQLIAAVFLAMSMPVFLYLLFRPAEYRASSKVLIKPSRGFLNVSPAAGAREDSISMLPSPEILNTEIQIIRSPELAERLAKDVPFPDRVNGQTPRALTEAEIRQDGRRLGGLLRASPVRASNLIEISVTSPYKQEWTAQAVNRAAELYLEEHLKAHKTPGVEDFYSEQEKKLRLELASAEDALKEFQH